MPTLVLTTHTHLLILDQSSPPMFPRSDAVRRSDGLWDVPVDDEVAAAIEAARLPGETDDQVVSRLVRSAIGSKPN
jgi:hypothetical protein